MIVSCDQGMSSLNEDYLYANLNTTSTSVDLICDIFLVSVLRFYLTLRLEYTIQLLYLQSGG